MHALIVGNGIAGVTAARHVRKARPEARITLVSDEGRVPYARTALMYVHMGVLSWAQTALYEERFWDANRIDRVVDRALGVDPAARTVTLAEVGPVGYDALLVATGSTPVVPDWLGAGLAGIHTLYGRADVPALDATAPRRAVVVGGGLIGVELAEMLRVRGCAVAFLVREPSYLPRVLSMVESALVAAEIRRHGVDLRFGAEVAQVEGPGRVTGVVTASGERIPAEAVGVGTGVRPNTAWLDGSGVETDRGVLVDPALATTTPGVWAAGDCAQLRTPPPSEPPTRPIWYTARLQGATAGLGMAGQPTSYAPGVFYNSAKFFDLEYQVYGDATPNDSDRTWTDGHRSVRFCTDDGRLVGISALGVRLRAAVARGWIAEGLSMDATEGRLADLPFDPEFTRRPFRGGTWQ